VKRPFSVWAFCGLDLLRDIGFLGGCLRPAGNHGHKLAHTVSGVGGDLLAWMREHTWTLIANDRAGGSRGALRSWGVIILLGVFIFFLIKIYSNGFTLSSICVFVTLRVVRSVFERWFGIDLSEAPPRAVCAQFGRCCLSEHRARSGHKFQAFDQDLFGGRFRKKEGEIKET
jgi:hypothetical protein